MSACPTGSSTPAFGKITFPPSVNGKTPTYTLASHSIFSGTVLTDTWDLAECPDTTGLLSHHQFNVASGTAVIYTDMSWDGETQLIYLRLYDPNCQVAGESAPLLDIGAVTFSSLAVTNPAPGTWTVGVYGRINAPYPYTGTFETYNSR